MSDAHCASRNSATSREGEGASIRAAFHDSDANARLSAAVPNMNALTDSVTVETIALLLGVKRGWNCGPAGHGWSVED